MSADARVLSQAILKQALTEAEQAEVVYLRRESTTLSFEANRLKSSQVDESSGIALRVLKDGRLGFAASSDEKLREKLVANALESAVYGDEVAIAFPPPQPAPAVVTFDASIAGLSMERMVEMGEALIDLVLQDEPDVQVYATLKRGVDRLSLFNQAGAEIALEGSPLSIALEARRIKGDDVLITYGMTGTTTWDDDYLAPAMRICDKLKLARRNATIDSGSMPVLFSPTGVLVFGLPLMAGLNGRNVYKGVSPMVAKIGQKLFDEKITIVDDATLDGKFGSASHDDEGVPHRHNVLVRHGVLRGFFYDLKTAAQSRVASTGNGSRSLFHPPSPSPTNLVVEAGVTPLAEMLAGVDNGLLVQDVLGLGQGNIISGAFSNPLSLAYKIEKGEIVGRVKNVSIAGNVYELLRDVAAVSRETQWVYSNYCLPHILLSRVNVISHK
jgi:PmbA protein